MSTLDQADVDVMKATKTCVSAERFQYDYLNDDIVTENPLDPPSQAEVNPPTPFSGGEKDSSPDKGRLGGV